MQDLNKNWKHAKICHILNSDVAKKSNYKAGQQILQKSQAVKSVFAGGFKHTFATRM